MTNINLPFKSIKKPWVRGPRSVKSLEAQSPQFKNSGEFISAAEATSKNPAY